MGAAEEDRQRPFDRQAEGAARFVARHRVDLALVARLEAVRRQGDLLQRAEILLVEALALGFRGGEDEIAAGDQPCFELRDEADVLVALRTAEHVGGQRRLHVVTVVNARATVVTEALVVAEHEGRLVDHCVGFGEQPADLAPVVVLAPTRQGADQAGAFRPDALLVQRMMQAHVEESLRHAVLAQVRPEAHHFVGMVGVGRRNESDVEEATEGGVKVVVAFLAAAARRMEGGEEVEDEQPPHAL